METPQISADFDYSLMTPAVLTVQSVCRASGGVESFDNSEHQKAREKLCHSEL
jgi:hypothetical protein